MIGRTLGRYQILAKLGEGGMGTVWKAQDQLLGRTVALKLISDRLLDSEQARERFLREARAASKLEHPGIATVFDTGQDDGLSYIAFQYIDGETLAEKLRAGPLALGEAVRIAIGAAEALAHAHGRGVLHRDVTSGNLMVAADGRAVIVDFGLALPERGAHLTTTGTAVGTASYLAPEVVMGRPADERSDLYSFGVVLYQMVTGRLPFESGPAEAVLFRAVHEAAAPPSALRQEIPRALDGIILRLLEKEPEDRYASARELVSELERLQRSGVLAEESATPEAGAAGWPGRIGRIATELPRAVRRTARRVGRLRLGVATVAAIAVVVFVAQWVWQRGWLPGAHAPVRTVAVLPMRNSSADPEETGYLAEGLGEELVTRLGQLTGVRVLPWITTQRYGDPKRPLPEIAKELRVDELLVGSYRSDGERIRVSVALVDGANGLQRWSQAYEEHVSDLIAVQKQIALGVGRELKGKITDPERERLAVAPSQNPEAYDYFLRGANYMHSADPQSQALAQPFFEKAIELDSTLAEAYVGLGAIHTDRYFRGVGGTEFLDQAERHFRHALQLNPKMAAAERGLMRVHYERGQIEEVLKIAHKAAQRGPDDVEALLVQGWSYTLGYLPEKAIAPLDRLIELDPANQSAAWFRVVALAWSERPDQTVEAGKAYIRKFGEDPEMYLWMAVASECKRTPAEARLYFERAIELFGDDQSEMYVVVYAVHFYLNSGNRDMAMALSRLWIERLEQRLRANPNSGRVRIHLVGLYAAVGDKAGVERVVGTSLGSASPLELTVLIPDLARVGDIDRALQLCRAVRASGNLAPGRMLLSRCAFAGMYGGLPHNLVENAEFQSFLRDVEAHLAGLRAQY
jgi:TolB-like protein